MGQSVNIQMKGDRELRRKFKKLTNSMQKTVCKKGCRDGAKVVQKEAKNNVLTMLKQVTAAYTKKGKLKKKTTLDQAGGESLLHVLYSAIQVRVRKKREKYRHITKTQMNPEDNYRLVYFSKQDGKRSYIPAAIEYGHKKVLWGRRTNERVKPFPFMRKAVSSKGNEAIRKTQDTMLAEIYKAMK